MDRQSIERINALARKAKTQPLTQEELAEQKRLRGEYIAEFKQIFRNTLENTYIQYEDGRRKKLIN